MAEIVLGIATSHGPMLSTPPHQWDLRVPDDLRGTHHYQGRTWSFEELVQLREREHLARQIVPARWEARHAACRSAIAALSDAFERARPDVAVLVGNDQMEIFDDSIIPAFSVLWGDKVVNGMYSDERMANLPPGIGVSVPGHIPPGGATYPAVPDLGRHIIETAIEDNFDVAAMKRLPKDETPHAFGFVYRQIMRDRVVPSVPVLVNTFYPPNQPSISRCNAFGKSLLRAIKSWPADARVALIASGGLTHFVIDENVDRYVLDSIRQRGVERIADLGEAVFQAGTSEIKNWIPVASAMADLGYPFTLVDYVPCYRTAAGTGNAMGFVYWQRPA